MSAIKCGCCAHAMRHETIADLLYCVRVPPTPIVIGDQVVSQFPLLRYWAKCSKFTPGQVQDCATPPK